jgi:hypothetical protein
LKQKEDEKIKIFIVTHKMAKFYEHKNFYPILVGTENNELKIELRDNSGENISLKNKNYCELTAMYWIWKNIKSDYIGVCHYRRYFNEINVEVINYNDVNKEKIKVKEDNIKRILKDYDLILPTPYIFNTSILEQYKASHNIKDFIELGKVIKEKYEKTYFKNWDIVINRNYFYPCNMMICKKELFNDYCKWLFDILFELEKRIDISDDSYQARVFGFLSERMLGLYVETNKLKVKQMNVTKLETTKEFFKWKIKQIVKSIILGRK